MNPREIKWGHADVRDRGKSDVAPAAERAKLAEQDIKEGADLTTEELFRKTLVHLPGRNDDSGLVRQTWSGQVVFSMYNLGNLTRRPYVPAKQHRVSELRYSAILMLVRRLMPHDGSLPGMGPQEKAGRR